MSLYKCILISLFCLVASRYSINALLFIFDRISLCSWPHVLDPLASASCTAMTSTRYPVELKTLVNTTGRKQHPERSLQSISSLSFHCTQACRATPNQASATQRNPTPSGGEYHENTPGSWMRTWHSAASPAPSLIFTTLREK